MVSIELYKDSLTLLDEDCSVTLTTAQWNALVEFVRSHPTDRHGWLNRMMEDGTLTGQHRCPCHNIA